MFRSNYASYYYDAKLYCIHIDISILKRVERVSHNPDSVATKDLD